MSFASQFNYNKDKIVVESTAINANLATYVDHAYGFRKIHPNYTGFCCRIRREEDLEEADVYFDGNGRFSLDSVAKTWEGPTGFKPRGNESFAFNNGKITGTNVREFIGNGDAALTRIYDQGGIGQLDDSARVDLKYFTGYHVKNTSSDTTYARIAPGANGAGHTEPSIIKNGALRTRNGRPSAELTGSGILQFQSPNYAKNLGLEKSSSKVLHAPSGLHGHDGISETFLVGSVGAQCEDVGGIRYTGTVNKTTASDFGGNIFKHNQLLGGHVFGFISDLGIGVNKTGGDVTLDSNGGRGFRDNQQFVFYYEDVGGLSACITGGVARYDELLLFSSFTNPVEAGFKVNNFRQTGQRNGDGNTLNVHNNQGTVARPTGVSTSSTPKYLFLGGPTRFSPVHNAGTGSFSELIFSTQNLNDQTIRFGIEKYMNDEFRMFNITGMENLSDAQRKSLGVDIFIPNYGATVSFKSNNSSWNGSSFYNFTTPKGLNSLSAEIDLSFTLNKNDTRKLLRRLESSSSGPLTGNVAFSGSDSVINFGEERNNFQINLDTGYYQNFKGSEISSYDINFISHELYQVNLKLYNNRISSFLNNGTGFVANRLVDGSSTTKKIFDVFSGDVTTFNSNVFDNYFYLTKDRDNQFQPFQVASIANISQIANSGGPFGSGTAFTSTVNSDGGPGSFNVRMPDTNLVHQGPSGVGQTQEEIGGTSSNEAGGNRVISFLKTPIPLRQPATDVPMDSLRSTITCRFKVDEFTSTRSSADVAALGLITSHPNDFGFQGYAFGFYTPEFHTKNGIQQTQATALFIRPEDVGSTLEFQFKPFDLDGNGDKRLLRIGGIAFAVGSGEQLKISDSKFDIDFTGFELDYSNVGTALKGLTTYTGFSGNATRTFFFQPDMQTNLNFDHSYRRADFDNSFSKSLNISRNQNHIGSVDLTFSNRGHNETYAMVHFLETHLGYKPFVYKYDDDLIKRDRVFYCDEWSHTFNYKDSNTIQAKFTEIVNPVTPTF